MPDLQLGDVGSASGKAASVRACRAALIDGLPISLASRDEILAEMDRAIGAGEIGHYIAITNTESMYHGLRDKTHGRYISAADFSVCDGVGVSVAACAWGHRIHRLPGPTLQLECSRHGVERGWRHFLYGGKPGVADAMSARLCAKFPGMNICGCYCPPFRPLTAEEDDAIIDLINATEPDIVWVGLGLLKQERWVTAHLGRVKAPWMIGVGAAFDFHSGAVPWAPAPLRKLGLEWIFQLALQPRQRIKRYLRSAIYVAQTLSRGVVTAQFLRPPRIGASPSITWRRQEGPKPNFQNTRS
ncbi:MAG: WecB/TagA/CpsF family glycosyltransferase [Alphaproteobacteria bacterium]|nr:WecB/TagA/CpsF family glycosyltransferase [Alphaproteobacteria bacterium]